MQSPFLRAALAAAALCAALPSQADGSPQALISNVKVRLIDLDTSDGVTPAITFVEGGYLATWISAPGANEDRIQINFALGTAASTTRTAGSHSVSLRVLAGELLGAGSGPGAVASYAGAGAGGVAGEAQVLFTDFSLTPNTRIEISASAAASTAGYVGAGGSFDAWAGAGVNLFSRLLQSSLSSDFINAYSNAQGQGPSTQARDLFAAYDNLADTPFSATLSAVAYLGAAEVAAVPEPASWLMLAGGLMALVLRRHKVAAA
jgi:hypothetical protein